MKRPVIIMCTILIALTIVGLFQVKHKVQNLKKDLIGINKQLAMGKQTLHVLNAEWAYLNEPARIQKLADRYLGLQHTKVVQVKDDNYMKYIYLAKSKHNTTPSVTPTLKPILSSMRSIR